MSKFTPIITVPAHNEEVLLPGLFASLAAQTWHEQNDRPLKVVIVLNNCTDNSRGAVEKAISIYPNLAINLIDIQYEKKDAHVGNARRLAMETAYDSCANPAQTAILTTDADSTPLPDWVTNNLSHLADGVDLVCGIIWLNAAEYEQLDVKLTKWTKVDQDYKQAVDHLDSLLNPTSHNPWPRHTDHTSQSFAIRADVYRAVGGLPPLPSGEDYALVERVSEAGYRIRHPLNVVVETSARLVGRAPGGQAEVLQSWLRDAVEEKPLLFEHPDVTRQRLESQDPKTKYARIKYDESKFIPAEKALSLLQAMIAELESSQNAA